MNRTLIPTLCILVAIAPLQSAPAGVESYAVREATEFVFKKFGREALEQGAEVLSSKIGLLASRYGDNALSAFRKVGPKVSKLIDDAGEHAPVALRLLAGHGDDGVRLVAKPKQLGLVARLGDDAAESLLKHGEVAEPLLQTFGASAAKALPRISPQNARRMAMMAADGQLSKLGRSDELLGVVSHFGDVGAEFVWRNKAALAVGAGLTAFLASPEAFINGGNDLASIVSEGAVKPLATAAAGSTPWFAIATIMGLACGLIGGWKYWTWRSINRQTLASSGAPATPARDPHLS